MWGYDWGMFLKDKNALVVLGPTASGKTHLGVGLAKELGGEVVSADSRQVYRGLDIGTGKDLEEYDVDGVRIPCHLIDIVDPGEEFNVFEYQRRFYAVFEKLDARNVLPVVVGGSGLYIEAVLKGYRMVEAPEDPELRAELEALPEDALVERLALLKDRLHNTTDLATRDRMIRAIEIAVYSRDHEPVPAPEIRPLILGTSWRRDHLRARIRQRLKERLDSGLIEEVERVHASGTPWARLEQLGLEYRFVAEFLQGKIQNKNDLFQKLSAAICRFAKRQDTWFRRMERNGTVIHWVPEARLELARGIIHDA